MRGEIVIERPRLSLKYEALYPRELTDGLPASISSAPASGEEISGVRARWHGGFVDPKLALPVGKMIN